MWARLIKQLRRLGIFWAQHRRASHLKRGGSCVIRKAASLKRKAFDLESSQTNVAGAVATIEETKGPSTLLRARLSSEKTLFLKQPRNFTLQIKYKISAKTISLIHTSDMRTSRADQQETTTTLSSVMQAFQVRLSSSRCLLRLHRCLPSQCPASIVKLQLLTRVRYQLKLGRVRGQPCQYLSLSFLTSRQI